MNAAHFLTHLSLTTILIIALPFAGAIAAGQVFDHIDDRFRFDWKSRRIVRRWYTTDARVRVTEGQCAAIREVMAWQQYDHGPTWLLLVTPDPDARNYRWVPLAEAKPYRVPAFRPHLEHGLPHLTRYIPAVSA